MFGLLNIDNCEDRIGPDGAILDFEKTRSYVVDCKNN